MTRLTQVGALIPVIAYVIKITLITFVMSKQMMWWKGRDQLFNPQRNPKTKRANSIPLYPRYPLPGLGEAQQGVAARRRLSFTILIWLS